MTPASSKLIEAAKNAVRAAATQSILVPEDIRPSAIQSNAILTLCRLDGGDVASAIDEKLREVVAACGALGRKGEITIKLKIAPGGSKRVAVHATVTAKIPDEENTPTALFFSPSGQLLASDPDQMVMDLKIVNLPPEAAVRDVLGTPPPAPTV